MPLWGASAGPVAGKVGERDRGRTLAVRRDPSQAVNTLLLGTIGGASGRRLLANAPSLPADPRPLAREAAARIAARLPGGRVYTDDVAPMEWLIDSSIVQVAADGGR